MKAKFRAGAVILFDQKMKTPPFFPFYPQNFLVGTIGMTPAERGAYIVAISLQWENGHLDLDKFFKMDRQHRRLWPSISSKFEPVCDTNSTQKPHFRNPRLEEERKKATLKHQRLSEFGRKGGLSQAQARLKHARAVPEPEPEPVPPLKSPPRGTDQNGQIGRIIEEVNRLSGSRFQTTESSRRLIGSRLREVDGDSQGICTMLSRQWEQWSKDSKMRQYFRIKTLFAASNFADYYGQREDALPATIASEPENRNRNANRDYLSYWQAKKAREAKEVIENAAS